IALLTSAVGHAEGSARVIPTGNTALAAHHTAGSAFETTGVFKAHLAIFEPIEARRAHHKTCAIRASGADGFVDDNMRLALIDRKLIHCQRFFRTQSLDAHRLRYAFQPSATIWPRLTLRRTTSIKPCTIGVGTLPSTVNKNCITSLASFGTSRKTRGISKMP